MIYRHDLILLGMGDDGHTASLFPGTAALQEKTRKVVANFVPKFNAWRITFTFPLINQARHICFLANANKNAALLEKVLAGDRAVSRGSGRSRRTATSPGFSVRRRTRHDSSFEVSHA